MEGECLLYEFTRESVWELEKRNPKLAHEFTHHIIVKLADTIERQTKEITVLLDDGVTDDPDGDDNTFGGGKASDDDDGHGHGGTD